MANTCGTHTELASNDAIKITRCTCGTVHVTFNACGVTLRLTDDQYRASTIGFKAGVERLDQPTKSVVPPSGTGSTSIN